MREANRQAYLDYGIDEAVLKLVESCEEEVSDILRGYDETAEALYTKILSAFAEERLSERHFAATTGYGYDDAGRDTLDRVYARVFGTEDALVRAHWAAGTHVLSDCLFALLRSGETLYSVTGIPYDTLRTIIGISGNVPGSLKDMGVNFRCTELLPDGSFDMQEIERVLREDKTISLVHLQRSRGYSMRRTIPAADATAIISFVRSIRPDVRVFVDNCYGEFTELEPPKGFDAMAGSLIKNPGGGIAPTGAYVVGRADAIERISYRLTAPGEGREIGSYAGGYRLFYQGLYFAPQTVAQALKTAVLFSAVFKRLGFKVNPEPDALRADIVQAVCFDNEEQIVSFCRSVQAASPVDSHVAPEPWDMPGYADKIIMAAGAFVSGSSIELSADAPMRKPYAVYFQGGLTYGHGRLACLRVVNDLYRGGMITL